MGMGCVVDGELTCNCLVIHQGCYRISPPFNDPLPPHWPWPEDAAAFINPVISSCGALSQGYSI